MTDDERARVIRATIRTLHGRRATAEGDLRRAQARIARIDAEMASEREALATLTGQDDGEGPAGAGGT